MGGGAWDKTTYTSSASSRAATGTDDFDYSAKATTTHSNLDPLRILTKPYGKLEARDSDEHPASTPVFIGFDVTGSNISRARVAQKRLPNLMDLLGKYVSDPQVAVAANDDFFVVGHSSIQISDFESDIRIDEHLRSIRLIGQGGGNEGESYDLLVYALARKTATDSMEKRSKKGYAFLYADEPFFKVVDRRHVKDVFGDDLEANIPMAEIIEEARRLWNIFIVFPIGGYDEAREQYVQLFGEDSVIDSQAPELICELIASTIGLYEKKVDVASVVTDLVAVGVSHDEASKVQKSLTRAAHHASWAVAPAGAGKADRL